MAVRDARGVEIKVGDTVIYVSSGRYTSREVMTVAEVAKRVRVDRTDNLSGEFVDKPATQSSWNTAPIWREGSSMFVVEKLPEVAGRLNT